MPAFKRDRHGLLPRGPNRGYVFAKATHRKLEGEALLGQRVGRTRTDPEHDAPRGGFGQRGPRDGREDGTPGEHVDGGASETNSFGGHSERGERGHRVARDSRFRVPERLESGLLRRAADLRQGAQIGPSQESKAELHESW